MYRLAHLHTLLSVPFILERFREVDSFATAIAVAVRMNEFERLGCAVMVALMIWTIYWFVRAFTRVLIMQTARWWWWLNIHILKKPA